MAAEGNELNIELKGLGFAGEDGACTNGIFSQASGVVATESGFEVYNPESTKIRFWSSYKRARVHKTTTGRNFLVVEYNQQNGKYILKWAKLINGSTPLENGEVNIDEYSESDWSNLELDDELREIATIKEDVVITTMKNLLVVGNDVYLYADGNYSCITVGGKIPFEMELGTYRNGLALWYECRDFDIVNEDKRDAEIFDYTKKNGLAMLNMLDQEARRVNSIVGMCFLRYAIKIYDGSYINISEPILVSDTMQFGADYYSERNSNPFYANITKWYRKHTGNILSDCGNVLGDYVRHIRESLVPTARYIGYRINKKKRSLGYPLYKKALEYYSKGELDDHIVGDLVNISDNGQADSIYAEKIEDIEGIRPKIEDYFMTPQRVRYQEAIKFHTYSGNDNDDYEDGHIVCAPDDGGLGYGVLGRVDKKVLRTDGFGRNWFSVKVDGDYPKNHNNDDLLSEVYFYTRSMGLNYEYFDNDTTDSRGNVQLFGARLLTIPAFKIKVPMPQEAENYVVSVDIFMTNPVSVYDKEEEIDDGGDVLSQRKLRDKSKVIEELRESEHAFYKIHSIPFKDIVKIPKSDDGMILVPKIDAGKIYGLLQQTKLNDNISRTQEYTIAYNYNSRLHIGDITEVLHNGFANGGVRANNSFHIKESNISPNIIYDQPKGTKEKESINYKNNYLDRVSDYTLDASGASNLDGNVCKYALNNTPICYFNGNIEGIKNLLLSNSMTHLYHDPFATTDFNGVMKYPFPNIIQGNMTSYISAVGERILNGSGSINGFTQGWSRGQTPTISNWDNIHSSFLYDLLNGFNQKVLSLCFIAACEVELKIDQNIKMVKYFIPIYGKCVEESKIEFNFGAQIYYPDSRATKLTITNIVGFVYTTTQGRFYCTARCNCNRVFELKSNFEWGVDSSSYINPDLRDIKITKRASDFNIHTDSRDWEEDILEVTKSKRNGNIMKVSNVNAPTTFELSHTYLVGDGDIIGFAAQSNGITDGQYGAAPFLVFTTTGIYQMDVDRTGQFVYTGCNIMSNVVCNNRNSIVPTDRGVIFSCEQGIGLALNSSVQFVFEHLYGDLTFLPTSMRDKTLSGFLPDAVFNNKGNGADVYEAIVTNNHLLHDIRNNLVACRFGDFAKMQNTIFSYNPQREELVVYNKNFDYHYLLNLSNQKATTMPYRIEFDTKDYPTPLYALIGWNSSTYFNNYTPRGERVVNGTSPRDVLLVSRPIKAAADNFFTHTRVVLRGLLNVYQSSKYQRLGLYVLGSNDCISWQWIGGSEYGKRSIKNEGEWDIIRDIGTITARVSEKYIIVIFAGKLLPQSRFTKLDVMVKNKYNNKLR